MPQYLYKIQPTRPEMLIDGGTDRENSIIAQHFQYLTDLKDAAIVLLAGRTMNTDDTSFGIVIFQAETDAQAREIVDNDPAVRQNVMRAELFPYRIAMAGRLDETTL